MNDDLLKSYLLPDEIPSSLFNSMQYSLLSPGKRIRPRLSLASSEYVGLPVAAGERLGASIEMIHSFTLIHDDLPCMDDDDFRRGRPSNHKVHGEAIALLAGNSLMALGYETFWGLRPYAADDVAFDAAFRLFFSATGARGVLGGQAFELELADDADFSDLLHLFTKKTGTLFDVPIRIPALLKGIKSEDPIFKGLSRFSEALGFAFQVADDLEDEAQDKNEDGTYATKSIFHHLSPEEARERARTALQNSSEKLSRLKSEVAAKSLLEIASEVLTRI